MGLSLGNFGSTQYLDDPPNRFSEAACDSSTEICYDVCLLGRRDLDDRIFPLSGHVRLVDIPVVEDPVDSNERGNIDRFILAKYPERRCHNDFNSGPLMADGKQRPSCSARNAV